MRIYLACTVRGNRDALATARHIRRVLESLGHTVLTSHLLEDDVDAVEAALTDGQVFERDLAWLEGAEALVAEGSGSSYGVGFEVGYTLARAPVTGQRVLLLFDQSRRGAISRLIAGNTDPRCHLLGYRTLGEIDDFLRRHLT